MQEPKTLIREYCLHEIFLRDPKPTILGVKDIAMNTAKVSTFM